MDFTKRTFKIIEEKTNKEKSREYYEWFNSQSKLVKRRKRIIIIKRNNTIEIEIIIIAVVAKAWIRIENKIKQFKAKKQGQN